MRSHRFFSAMQLLGGAILSSGYIPQIAQVLRTGLVRDLNLASLTSIFAGIVCMETYAIYLARSKRLYSFAITNTVSLMLSGTMLVLKIVYGCK